MSIRKITSVLRGFALILALTYSSCDKEVSISQPEAPAVKRDLFVNSNPGGALIYINGKNTGHYTPDTLKWLEATENAVLLKLTYYYDTTLSITVNEEQKKSLYVDYLANPGMYGKVVCTTEPPGANIYLNDSLISYNTPSEFKLAPGKYEFKYKLFGYASDSINAIVKSGVTTPVFKELKDTSIWYTFNTSNSGLPSNFITAVAKSNSQLWVGTSDAGLALFQNQTWKVFNTENSPLPSNSIRGGLALNTSNNDLWVGTSNGIAVYRNGSWTVYNSYNSCMRDNYVYELKYDKYNDIIYAATKEGLVTIKTGYCYLYDTSNTNLPTKDIHSIDVSPLGDLWVGWNGGVAVKSKIGNFNSFVSYTELPLGNDISAIKAGVVTEGIWVGSASAAIPPPTGGLMYLQDGTWVATEITGTINDIQIINSDIWMAKQSGLYKVTKSGYITYNTGNSYLPNNYVNAIAGDNKVIWIGTYGGGLARFKFN